MERHTFSARTAGRQGPGKVSSPEAENGDWLRKPALKPGSRPVGRPGFRCLYPISDDFAVALRRPAAGGPR